MNVYLTLCVPGDVGPGLRIYDILLGQVYEVDTWITALILSEIVDCRETNLALKDLF